MGSRLVAWKVGAMVAETVAYWVSLLAAVKAAATDRCWDRSLVAQMGWQQADSRAPLSVVSSAARSELPLVD